MGEKQHEMALFIDGDFVVVVDNFQPVSMEMPPVETEKQPMDYTVTYTIYPTRKWPLRFRWLMFKADVKSVAARILQRLGLER